MSMASTGKAGDSNGALHWYRLLRLRSKGCVTGQKCTALLGFHGHGVALISQRSWNGLCWKRP